MVTALEVALRNSGIRRLQIVWGAAIAAEWGHFVALGVFAYERGGTGPLVESIGTLAGPLVAGLLVSAASVGLALAVWAGAVLVAAAVLLGLEVESAVARGAPKTVYRELAAGLESLGRIPGARLVGG